MSVLARSPKSTETLQLLVLGGLFFSSGFTALCIELVFSKYLGFVFGTTAYATSTVLAAFMGGLALGNLMGGRLSNRLAQPVLWYGRLELLVGVYALLAPLLFSALAAVVSGVGARLASFSDGAFYLTALRFGLSWLVILPPTIMMGMSFPLLSRHLANSPSLGKRLTSLYTINTLGAAIGTLAATYFLISLLGLFGTLIAAALVNGGIFLGSITLQRSVGAATSQRKEAERTAAVPPASSSSPSTAQPSSSSPPPQQRPAGAAVAYLLALFSGFVTLSFEVVWSHVLALLVGTSAYALGLVLTIFLIALAVGGTITSRYLSNVQGPGLMRVLSLILLSSALFVLASLPLWESANDLFEFAGRWKLGFVSREVVRSAVVVLLIFLPAVAMGTLFPLTLSLHGSAGAEVGRKVGLTVGLNTAGTILGSTLTGFYLLEKLGSEWTMRALAIVLLCAALPLLMSWPRWWERTALGVAMTLLASQLVLQRPWDISRMTTGANIYFSPSYDRSEHRLVALREDVHGGFTTVVTNSDTTTLMTNGKFEGNDGAERVDQVLFATIPNLFVKKRKRALNIGIGTGQTAAVLHGFGFKNVDAVDISPNIVWAAKKHFRSVNRGVFDRSNVNVFYRDGRNHLLIHDQPYDLISIELTSVWFASSGNLYSRSFYQLCKEKLRDHGVLQQWVQLHHISLEDIASIMRTLKGVFPHVELWKGGHQGILLASETPLKRTPLKLGRLGKSLRTTLYDVGLDADEELASHLLIPSARVDAVLASISSRPDRFSTDNNLLLEYSTPRANAAPDTFRANMQAIREAVR